MKFTYICVHDARSEGVSVHEKLAKKVAKNDGIFHFKIIIREGVLKGSADF